MALGFRGYDMHDPNRYALGLLGVMLGGNTSSRLWDEIREKLGLAYYVRASSQNYTDTGYLIANAGIPHGELKKVVSKIVEVFSEVKKNSISQKEIDFAKDYLRGTLALSFESSDEIATFLGEQALFYNKIETPQDLFAKIEKVSKDDIMKVAKELIRSDKLNLAVIGPHRESAKYQRILAGL